MLSFIISVAAGALIGYITNHIAITMLFRPYKKKLFLQGVIPAKIEEFSTGIAEGYRTTANNLLNDPVAKKKLVKVFISLANMLPLHTRFLCGIATIDMNIWDNMLFKRILKRFTLETAAIIEDYLGTMDIAKMETLVRDTLNTEFWMLEIYGLVLGGLLGAVTFLISHIL